MIPSLPCHVKSINVHVSTRFDQIHKLFHKILSIKIILKSIKGHNSVEKLWKIMCFCLFVLRFYGPVNS